MSHTGCPSKKAASSPKLSHSEPRASRCPPLVDEMGRVFRGIGQYRMVPNFVADPGDADPTQGAFPNVNRQGMRLTDLLASFTSKASQHEFLCPTAYVKRDRLVGEDRPELETAAKRRDVVAQR